MPVPSNPQDLINIIREKLFNNTSGLIEEPDLREVLENIVKVLDAKFSMFTPNLTEEQFAQWNLILDYMANETKGVLSPTSPAPTEKGKYLLASSGTYTNLGGLVATADKLNYAYFDGTTWSLISVEFTANLSDYYKKDETLSKSEINNNLSDIDKKITLSNFDNDLVFSALPTSVLYVPFNNLEEGLEILGIEVNFDLLKNTFNRQEVGCGLIKD